MVEKTKGKANWGIFIKTCPSCKSSEVIKINKFKREWIQKKNGRWELIERQFKECKACGNTWWD